MAAPKVPGRLTSLLAVCALAALLTVPGPPVFASGTAPQVRGILSQGAGWLSGTGSTVNPPAGTSHRGLEAHASGSPTRVVGVAPAKASAPRAALGIDPLLDYSREPAPMGIADFGVEGVGAASSPYSYSTSSFEAHASVRSMNASVGVTAFELNAMLALRWSGANYTYWIQNGLHVAPAALRYTIGGAYVWNFSAPGARLAPAELQGANGSVLATDTFYYIPSCNGLPGQCTTLNWPTVLTARIDASEIGGIPTVAYQYDLGSGWVTYDTVSFPHLAGADVLGFLVNGFVPTPYASGLFYDAEWDWVAAGGGGSMVVKNSDLSMSLAFWNGHNYQAVPSAWDFGSDTGETTSNVTESLLAAGPDGLPSAQVANGAGTLGVLYNQSECGYLNVTSPTVPNGTLDVAGIPVTFGGNAANLTLAAGTYSVTLQNYSNTSRSVTITAGETYYLNLSGAGWTTFRESGLPSGTFWGLTVGGVVRSAKSTTLSFTLPTGTYSIKYAPVPGYYRNVSDPVNVTVPATSPVLVEWTTFTFQVPVTESGLPSGTVWWVNASGRMLRGSATTLAFSAPNGSTPFSVGSVYEFVATPSDGTIDVTAGAFAPVDVQFAYRPSFIAGTVNPPSAVVTINGTPLASSGGSFNASVIPGTYTLVANASGYATKTVQVTVTPGNTTFEHVVLTKAPIQAPPTGANTSSAGTSVPLILVGVGVGVAAVVAALVVVLTRKRGGGAPPS